MEVAIIYFFPLGTYIRVILKWEKNGHMKFRKNDVQLNL